MACDVHSCCPIVTPASAVWICLLLLSTRVHVFVSCVDGDSRDDRWEHRGDVDEGDVEAEPHDEDGNYRRGCAVDRHGTGGYDVRHETFQIVDKRNEGSFVELHIRTNVQANIEIRDAADDTNGGGPVGRGGGGGASWELPDGTEGLLGLVDVTTSVPRGRQSDNAQFEMIINQSAHDVSRQGANGSTGSSRCSCSGGFSVNDVAMTSRQGASSSGSVHHTVVTVQLDYAPVNRRRWTMALVLGLSLTGSAVLLILLLVAGAAALVWFWRRRHRPSVDAATSSMAQCCGPTTSHPGDGEASLAHVHFDSQNNDEEFCSGEIIDRGSCCQSRDHRSPNGSPRGYQIYVLSQPTSVAVVDGVGAARATRVGCGSNNGNNNGSNGGGRSGGGGGGGGRGSSTTFGLTVVCGLLAVAGTYSVVCSSQPSCNIVVALRPLSRILAVKLFINKVLWNRVVTDHWFHHNSTLMEVFGLDDSSFADLVPCFTDDVCPPGAVAQGLAGCDPATGRCICHNGYQLEGGVCVDVDECATGLFRGVCGKRSNCQNTVGSFICHCHAGFFSSFDRHPTCRACSRSCPPGKFESRLCTNITDRVCAACSRCDEYSIEVIPCTRTSDTVCAHAAHPQPLLGETTEPKVLHGLEVRVSDNVIVEDLHRTRNLETTYYVTDTTQASDFYWDRESGIRVNIGIHDVHLIAEFTDVDHEGADDNKYIMGNPVDSDDKNKFIHVVENFCRHPVPDYYSVTLEIYRNRTTAGHVADCATTVEGGSAAAACSQQRFGGDVTGPLRQPDASNYHHVERSLNDNCPKTGFIVDPLHSAANSVVCVDDVISPSSLFSLFRRMSPRGADGDLDREPAQTPHTFPSKRCRTAAERCNACLNHQRCLTADVTDQQCCQVDCLPLEVCKEAFSDRCRLAPVECATGDAHRYTVQPVFNTGSYRCHIEQQRTPVDVLYELFIFVQVPSVGYKTAAVHQTVKADSIAHRRRGQHIIDFLTVDHDAGLDLRDEFLLVSAPKNAYKLLPVVAEGNSADTGSGSGDAPTVDVVSRDIRIIAAAQFERPFDYSSSTWGAVATGSDVIAERDATGSCAGRNASKLRPLTPGDVAQSASGGRDVTAYVTQGFDGSFHYFLQAADSPPHFRFTVPGNMSILPYYFRDGGPRLVVNSSLSVTMDPPHGPPWNIHITGRVTDCPAYVGITINERSTTGQSFEVLRDDLLVLCPVRFNISVTLPSISSSSSRPHHHHHQQQLLHTFEVRIEYAQGTSFTVFLTQLGAHLPVVTDDVARPSALEQAAALTSPSMTMFVVYVTVLVVAIATGYVALLFYIRAPVPKSTYNAAHNNSNGRGPTSPRGGQPQQHHSQPCVAAAPSSLRSKRRRTRCRLLPVWIYVVFTATHGLLVTFSVLYVTLTSWLRPEVDLLMTSFAAAVDGSNNEPGLRAQLRRNASDVVGVAQQSLWNDLGRQERWAEEAVKACDLYTDRLVAEITDVLTATSPRRSTTNSLIASERVTSSLHRFVEAHRRSSVDARNRFAEKLESVDRHIGVFQRSVTEALDGDWLRFPRLLLNSTATTMTRGRTLASPGPGKWIDDMATLLEIGEIGEVVWWRERLWQRFNRFRPRLTLPPVAAASAARSVRPSSRPCNPSDVRPLRHAQPDQLDSVRFFAAVSADATLRPSTVDEDPTSWTETLLDPVGDGGGVDVSAQVLFRVGILLDVLLLLHRVTVACVKARRMHRKLTAELDVQSADEVAQPWPPVDQSQSLQLLRHQNGGGSLPVAAAATSNGRQCVGCAESVVTGSSNDVIRRASKSRDDVTCRQTARQLRHVTSVLSDIIVSYVAVTAGTVCLVCAAFSACAVVLDRVASSFIDCAFLLPVTAFVQSINAQLIEESMRLNGLIATDGGLFRSKTDSELTHLQHIVKAFNSAVGAAGGRFAADEMCMTSSGRSSNCAAAVTSSTVHAYSPHLLPCNVLPLQPHLYTGFKYSDYERLAVSAVQPYIAAVRSVVTATSLAAVVVIATAVANRLAGRALFRYLRMSPDSPPQSRRLRRRRRRRDDVVGRSDVDSCTEHGGCGRRLATNERGFAVQSDAAAAAADDDVYGSDSDVDGADEQQQEEEELQPAMSPVSPSTSRRPIDNMTSTLTSPTPSVLLMCKYTETK